MGARHSRLPWQRRGTGFDPNRLPNKAARYDVSDVSSLTLDASNRCQLIADKSGNSSENCLVLPGVSGNYASTLSSAALNAITSEVEFIVRAKSNDWTSTTKGAMVGKYDSSGVNKRQYAFYSSTVTSNRLRLAVSANGTTPSTMDANANNPFGSSALVWLKANIVGDEGGVTKGRFYYSLDTTTDPTLVSWTQIGTAVTATLYYPTWNTDDAPLEIGSVSVGTTLPFSGNIYRAIVKDGIDGTTVFDADFSLVAKLATSFTESSSEAATVTITPTAIALPARIHGARDLYMGTAASQPTYLPWEGSNYGWLNGVVGNRFTSPYDATYAITTGSIDIIACVALDNWTPPVSNAIVSRRQLSGIGICYSLRVDSSTGYLSFLWSPDGTSGSAISVTSGVAPTVSNFEKLWIRVFRTAATGAYVFYTSADGVSWTVLASGTGTSGSLFSNTTGIEIGGSGSGTILPTFGKIYSARVWNGDSESGGTLVSSFAASDYPSTGGSTFVSSETGETWTINGGAKLVTRTGLYFDGSNDYMKTAPFALSQPENVYAVLEKLTWTSVNVVLDGGSNVSMGITERTSSPNLIVRTAAAVSNLLSFPFSKVGVLFGLWNGSSSLIRLNRNVSVSGNLGTAATDGFTLGARHDGTLNTNIFASEILIYDTTAHDAATQDRMALALGRKWRLSV
jgi:hypothetical protein